MHCRMAETGARILRTWLLIALRELGDAAPRQAVHQAVETLFGSQFTSEDKAALEHLELDLRLRFFGGRRPFAHR